MRRRSGVILLLAALFLAACGSSGDDDADGGNGDDLFADTTVPPNNGTGPDGQPTTTAKNGGSGGPTSTAKGATNTTRGNSSATTTTANSDAAIQAAAKGGVGAFARTLLRPQPATQVVLEVFQMDGAEPTQETLNHVLAALRDATRKTVNLSGPITVPDTGDDLTEAEIEGIADTKGKAAQGGGQAVIHVVFANGAFNGDDSVLGIAVRGDAAAVLSEQVRSVSSPLASRTTIEKAVTTHEIGHILGLVDIVRNTGRADREHPGHSTNRDSVMFWAVESDLFRQVLGGPPPVNFDDADRADLAALRGGA
jgi:hypothetical protein